MLASEQGYELIILLLLDHGANVDLKEAVDIKFSNSMQILCFKTYTGKKENCFVLFCREWT
jgi:putative transposon-encoded protein